MAKSNKEILSENLKRYMKKNGVDRNKLIDDLNFKYMTVSDWINAKTYPRIDKIEILANYFNITKSDLVDEHPYSDISNIYTQLNEPRQQKVYTYAENQLEEQNQLQSVQVVGKTAAGAGLTYGDADTEEHLVKSVPNGAEVALVVQGDSMEELISDGDIVFYKRQPQVENGEIAVVELHNNEVTTKKIKYDFENEKIILQSLNDKYDDMIFENDEVRILGKVVF